MRNKIRGVFCGVFGLLFFFVVHIHTCAFVHTRDRSRDLGAHTLDTRLSIICGIAQRWHWRRS